MRVRLRTPYLQCCRSEAFSAQSCLSNPRPPPPALPQVSVDGEVQLYEACAHAGITLLSIAHRPTLKRFHQKVVHFDGNVSGSSKGWW